MTPDSINMELENIVANTVLLKAREGKDGDGGVTAPLPPVLHRCTGGEGCPGWGGGDTGGGTWTVPAPSLHLCPAGDHIL